MLLTMLKCKLHRATVTECDLHYEGSISIDRNLIEAAGLLVNERVEIYDIDNGNRFATYVIEGKAGTGVIGLNGAAARLVCVGDKLIICAYAQIDATQAERHAPTVVIVGPGNTIAGKNE
ncbi:MAG: aspartate 1-decarboxylase [Hyphomicrobiaceae bacterium]|nr:aspartate 1-decarboxylase [Hyphomicrobiaceae bacterium]